MPVLAFRPRPLSTETAPAALARATRILAAGALAALLAACQTLRPSGERDGPEANPPPHLEAVPDAVPQIEPIRIGGPNKPYQIDGQTYVPLTDGRAVTETGLASWYGKKFHGHRTSSGEAYNMYAMTAAHKTLPIPSYARVRNPANGKEVIVRVNDRGPFAAGRVIDLSYTAALKLGVLGGVRQVEVTRITEDDIRAGNFAHGPAYAVAPAPAAQAAAAEPDRTKPAGNAAGAAAVSTAADPAARDAGAPQPPAPTSTPIPETSPGSANLQDAAPPVASTASPREEKGHAETAAAAGFWVQLGAYRQRDGALDFQHRLGDAQPWLAPLLAVFADGGLNKLQAGPYPSRDEARRAADKIRVALQLVPTIVEKR
jgi:rare lipoprotein A